MHRECRTACAALLLLALVCASASGQTVKLGSVVPKGSPWEAMLKRLSSEWAEISGGSVEVKVYAGGVAGDDEDMVRKMRIGQLQGAALSYVGLTQILSGIVCLASPMLIRTEREIEYVWNALAPLLEDEFRQGGFELICWTLVGWGHLFCRDPVPGPRDLQGHTMWIMEGSSQSADFWRAIGCRTLACPTTDVLLQLHSGALDAILITPLLAAAYQWFPFVRNMSDLPWVPYFGAIVLSARTWDQVPVEMRRALKDSANRMAKQMTEAAEETNREAVSVMQAHGLAVHHVSEEMAQEWRRLVEERLRITMPAGVDMEFLAMVQGLLREYRGR